MNRFSLIEVDCPLCGSAQRRLLFLSRDYVQRTTEQAFGVCRCQRCGVGYLSPRPREEDIGAFYGEDYYWLHENRQASLTAEQLLEVRGPQLLAKSQCLEHLTPGRLLDVGAQKGEFLHVMAQRRWQVEGVEYFTTPANLFGVPIRYGDFLAMDLPRAAYDCVTMWAVLEHVYKPREYVANIAGILKPGGRFIGLATNFNSVQGRCLQEDDFPRHLTLFTKNALRSLLAEHGLRVVRLWTDQKIFGGSVCGGLTYLVKRIAGCSPQQLFAERKDPADPLAFCCKWHGRPSWMVKQVSRADKLLLTPVDFLLDRMGLGFNLSWEAIRVGSAP